MAVLVFVPGLWSCGHRQAGLEVELAAAPHVSPQFFHGNCQAGWILALDLRVRETNGVAVALDWLTYEVDEPPGGAVLGADGLDQRTLGERYGQTATNLEPEGVRDFPVGMPVDAPMSGPLAVWGEVRGADGSHRVSRRFWFTTRTVVEDAAPGLGGACSVVATVGKVPHVR